MDDDCIVENVHIVPKSLPTPILKNQTNMAPNKGDIESSDINMKQGHPLLDASNVSTTKMPLANDTRHNQEEANFKIEKPPVRLQSANDQNATMLEHCRGDFSSRLDIKTPLSENQLIDDVLMDEQSENVSPILQQHNIIRPKTPPMPVNITEIFSPNTVKQVRSTIRALFPNGPPPPKPVIPVKRHKKGDAPYIVGCTKRRRVPENKSLSVFKGDKYGITKETNSDNEECTLKKKRCGKRKQYANWSKSRFNPVSEEIAERLKKGEKVDIMQRKSPSKDTKNTTSFMSKPYTPRPQAFSPLPSTSKDSETIMKNEKHFSESLRYKNYNSCDDEDDDELPDIQWESKNISQKKRPDSLLQSRDNEIIFNEEPSVKSEDLNNNNNTSPAKVDLCEIQFDKYMPKKEYAVPELTNAATGNEPIIIDEIDLDKVVENSEPKRVLGQIPEVIETLEINEDYSSITYEDLYSVPKATEPIDVDELLKDLENYQQKQKKIYSEIITIVDNADFKTSQSQQSLASTIPKQASDVDNLAVKMIPPKEPSVTVEARANIVEPVDIIEIPDCVSVFPEPRNRLTLQTPTNDVEFVSETILENVNNSISTNSTCSNSADNSNMNSIDNDEQLQSVMTRYFFGDLNPESNDDPTHELHSLFRFLTDDHSCSSFLRPRSRKKKSKKSKGPPQESSSVNNENAAPSTNVQTESPTNGERRLGDCPICMENLARGSIASTTCGHVFCLDCIKTCLRTNGKKCPTCRKTLKGIGYHLIFL